MNDRILAATAVALAARIYPHLTLLQALFLGADARIAALARQFASPRHAFARDLEAAHAAIDELHLSDIVVSSFVAPQPLIGKARVALALRLRRRRPMLLIDLASPRSIDPAVAELEDAFVYTANDLLALLGGGRPAGLPARGGS